MRLNAYKRRGLITALLVGALLAVSGLAVAAPGSPHPADADAEELLAPIAYEYVQDRQLLVYWLVSDEPTPGEVIDCTEGLVGTPDVAEAAATSDLEVELPEGCHTIDVTGPNGQINHGTIMSAFVHSLKDIEFDGPRGHAIRELAHSELGKGDQQVKTGDVTGYEDNGDDDDEIDDSGENQGPPPHANSNSRDKKPKKPKK